MTLEPDKQLGMTIEEEYTATHSKSQGLYRRAKEVIPSGLVHDVRHMIPFPVYMDRGAGSKVWDVDGNEYIDYHPGHGTYILGYRNPAIVEAIKKQLDKGIEFGSCNELEIRAAELVVEMIPCAEQVRFIGSGAEANMLAIRIARAYTGKDKVIKFRGHWHGAFDGAGFAAVSAPFDVPYSAGTSKEAFKDVLLANHNSSEDVRRFAERGDVACVIMEPTGAHHGMMPNRLGFIEEVRQITKEMGIVLIWDEVMTNFKLAAGGAQEVTGVIPDLVTLGKSLGCGMVVAAVAGRKQIMQQLAFTGDKRHDRYQRVRSQGTHSGTPIALAATVAGLEILKSGEVQARMNRLTGVLRKGLNEQIKKHNVRGCAYGDYSIVRIFLNHNCPYLGKCDVEHCSNPDLEMLDAGMEASLRSKVILALLLNGINCGLGLVELFVSGAITEQDIKKTVEAFDRSLARLKAEKVL